MVQQKKLQPGDGIRSLKTTNIFRAVNFELYVKPNRIIMGVGATLFVACLGYMSYMRYQYESAGYYAGVKLDGSEQYYKRKSNWD